MILILQWYFNWPHSFISLVIISLKLIPSGPLQKKITYAPSDFSMKPLTMMHTELKPGEGPWALWLVRSPWTAVWWQTGAGVSQGPPPIFSKGVGPSTSPPELFGTWEDREQNSLTTQRYWNGPWGSFFIVLKDLILLSKCTVLESWFTFINIYFVPSGHELSLIVASWYFPVLVSVGQSYCLC